MMAKTLISLAAATLIYGVTGAQAAERLDFVNTPQHPVLTKQEAASFTAQNYLTLGSDHWALRKAIIQATPYVVGNQSTKAPYQSIQKAINAAIAQNTNHQPISIKVLPGRYQGTVYIPQDAPQITLYGSGENAQDVVINLAIDSMISPEQYQSLVNSDGQYSQNDPAWYMYHNCASTPNKVITTVCSAVIWSQSDRFTLANLTVENSLLDAIGSGTHQGVALRTDGDQVLLDNVRLIGRQDTFFVNNADTDNQYNTQRRSRVYIHNSFIEGDVDYVFGRAQAVFDGVEFHTVSSRGVNSAYVFAPDTTPNNDYGFLVTNSTITCDAKSASFKPKLGRAWEQGASKTGYLPGKTANGQLVIEHSEIQDCYDLEMPWGAAATTNRAFHGNAERARDLNDVNFNRLWLFENHLFASITD